MKPLTIVAYFDGRPGHEKQTRSILQSLAAMTATNVVHKKAKVSSSAYCKNWAAYILTSLRILKQRQYFGPADLIIGTGTYTHIPMLLEKEARRSLSGAKVRAVTCMTPDTLLRSKFDLCFVPRHDEPPVRKNVFVTLGPPCPVLIDKKHAPDRGLILIGGIDKKSHTWKSRIIADQIKSIIQENPSMQWTVSSSPRTPEDTCRDMELIASSQKRLSFYRSGNTPPGWIEEQYGLHETVWVTADSISMVYEALTAGCAVGILPVEWLRRDNKFQNSLDFLHEKKMLIYFSEWQNGMSMVVPGEPLNEAGRCALEIMQRWWPARLQ